MANIRMNKFRVYLYYKRGAFPLGRDIFDMSLKNVLIMFNDAYLESVQNDTIILVLNIKEDYEKEVMHNKLIALGYIKE